jgi:hypothetical protein
MPANMTAGGIEYGNGGSKQSVIKKNKSGKKRIAIQTGSYECGGSVAKVISAKSLRS